MSSNTVSKNQIRLYGKNIRYPGVGRSYWTDIEAWKIRIEQETGLSPVTVNVTTKAPRAQVWGRDLSPIRMDPVETYPENGVRKMCVSVEVAWQYSKIYSQRIDGNRLVPLNFIRDGHPTPNWFKWRDDAWNNPLFHWDHPDFDKNKKFVRRAFPKGSPVYGWYWDGKVIRDPVEARRSIYGTLYCREVVKTGAFSKLVEIYGKTHLIIYDIDGYGYVELGMTPEQTIRDTKHSWGHGLLLTLLLQGIDPTGLA